MMIYNCEKLVIASYCLHPMKVQLVNATNEQRQENAVWKVILKYYSHPIMTCQAHCYKIKFASNGIKALLLIKHINKTI